MGKKSRRQREKDAGPQAPKPHKVPACMRGTITKNNAIRKLFDHVDPEDGALRGFDTVAESHKVYPAALRLLGTERMYSYTDREWEKNQRVWAMRNAIVAKNPEDEVDLDNYLCVVVGNQFFKMYLPRSTPVSGTELRKLIVLDEAAVARWSRVKPHWRRFRRRLCTLCHNHAHLSEPRYLVCSGCGVARYCSEECHVADWPQHQEECCGGGLAFFKSILAEGGISKEEAEELWEASKDA